MQAFPIGLGQETLLLGEGVLGGRPKVHGEGALGEGACSLRHSKTQSVLAMQRVGYLKHDCPH